MNLRRRLQSTFLAFLFVALSAGMVLAQQDDQSAYPAPNAPQQSYPDQAGQQSYPSQPQSSYPQDQYPQYPQGQQYPQQQQYHSSRRRDNTRSSRKVLPPSSRASRLITASSNSRTLQDAWRVCSTCRERFRCSPVA